MQSSVALENLRFLMKKYKQCLEAYIVPTEDSHQNEYISQHDARRAFISGFNGSAGTAVVTSNKAFMWTDGRYYQQAEKQLDSNWVIMKDGLPSTPSIGKWICGNIPNGSNVGVDPNLLSYRQWKPIEKDLKSANCTLLPIEENLIDLVWKEQPSRSLNPILYLEQKFSGVTVADKWKDVKNKMSDKKASALVVTSLDEIAWFLNLRGSDIDFNPVFFAYLIIEINSIKLFIDESKLPKYFKDYQEENGVHIIVQPYDCIGRDLKAIVNSLKEGKIWISSNSSYFLSSLIPKNIRIQEITPLALNKAVKNKSEIMGLVNCHIRDGVALSQYFAWLEYSVINGMNVNEISGAAKLEEFRSKNEYYKGLSFPTISSSGINGSIIHYHPTEDTNRPITVKEIYLCDSGAQYMMKMSD